MSDDLRSAMTAIYQKRGKLTPELLVDAARPAKSPLHDRFEWDDTIAGEAYRRVQAQALIRSVHYEFTESDAPDRKTVRGWISVRSDPEREGYAPTEEVLSDPLSAELVLREFARAIADLKRQYGHLAEFAEMLRDAAA